MSFIFPLDKVKKYFVAVFLLWQLVSAAQADPLRVTVLMAEENPSFREFAAAFARNVLLSKLPVDVNQATSPPPNADLIVAVGIKSAAIAVNIHVPVLSVMVSKSGFEQLLQRSAGPREINRFSAIYMDQSGKRQIELIAAVLPEIKNVGLLYSANSEELAGLRKAIKDKGYALSERKLESAETLHRDLLSVLQRGDVLLAIPDAKIYTPSTMRNILLETYREKDPVVGFSPSFVKAGALCAVFSTPEQIAKQAAQLTKHYIESGRLQAAQYPIEFELSVNLQVAHSLGIRVKEIAELSKQIRDAESAEEGR